MSEFSRYRGTHRLATNEVAKIVLQILRETPETRHHDRIALDEITSELLAAGVGGQRGDDPSTEGYPQILAMLAGVLLRIAGASVAAVTQTVGGRDTGTLESLIDSIRGRMAQMAEAGEPVARLQPRSASDGASVVHQPAPVSSVPAVASPFPAESGLGARLQVPESAPMQFLRDLADDSILRIVRNVGRGAAPVAGPGLHLPPHTPLHGVSGSDARRAAREPTGLVESSTADRSRATPVSANPAIGVAEIDIGAGVRIAIEARAARRYAEPAQRAELIRAFAIALERHFGGSKDDRSGGGFDE